MLNKELIPIKLDLKIANYAGVLCIVLPNYFILGGIYIYMYIYD